jgi:hypothetical protein
MVIRQKRIKMGSLQLEMDLIYQLILYSLKKYWQILIGEYNNLAYIYTVRVKN